MGRQEKQPATTAFPTAAEVQSNAFAGVIDGGDLGDRPCYHLNIPSEISAPDTITFEGAQTDLRTATIDTDLQRNTSGFYVQGKKIDQEQQMRTLLLGAPEAIHPMLPKLVTMQPHAAFQIPLLMLAGGSDHPMHFKNLALSIAWEEKDDSIEITLQVSGELNVYNGSKNPQTPVQGKTIRANKNGSLGTSMACITYSYDKNSNNLILQKTNEQIYFKVNGADAQMETVFDNYREKKYRELLRDERAKLKQQEKHTNAFSRLAGLSVFSGGAAGITHFLLDNADLDPGFLIAIAAIAAGVIIATSLGISLGGVEIAIRNQVSYHKINGQVSKTISCATLPTLGAHEAMSDAASVSSVSTVASGSDNDAKPEESLPHAQALTDSPVGVLAAPPTAADSAGVRPNPAIHQGDTTATRQDENTASHRP